MMNKVKAKISKLVHRGKIHIKVDIPNDPSSKAHIKKVANSKFSRTHLCWYIPNSYEAIESLRQYFDVESTKPLKNSTLSNKKEAIDPLIERDKKFKINQNGQKTFKVFSGNKIHLEKQSKEWTKAFVPYDKKGWIAVIKEIPGRKWEVEGKYWLLPHVKDTYNRLNNLIGEDYLIKDFPNEQYLPNKYKFQKAKKKLVQKLKFSLNDYQKRAIKAFEEKLLLEHKAWRTIKTYKGLFIHFLAYFSQTKPSKISKEQIEEYIVYRKQENVSDSQLNQLINCLNCFFIRMLKQEEKVIKLERPKKRRQLPNVFSLEEIERLLRVCTNLKHKSMLMLIYSGGLRRSEVLNLRVDDLSFERKTLFVKSGKGGKDRYPFFSDVARKYIERYLEQYHPKYYLFEGQYGGRYGESSIQKVFDEAKRKAKVTSSVTIHGLRHSFATHLIEKRVPLHVVQELLGHHSIKTTEIYLHISNKFREELRSPLDDMQF